MYLRSFITVELYHAYVPDKATLRIESDTRDKLRAEKQGGETYTDVIERLLEDA